jgi:oligo-alginate lyase
MKYLPILLFFCLKVSAQTHPSLMLTKKNLEAVRAGITKYPLLNSSFEDLKKDADKAVATPINVPTPADGGGGITHEQHKNNYKAVNACGIAFQLTKDERYAKYVKDMLFAYAKVYNTWGRHPKRKQQPGGKLFWQNLNDCVWLVYMIQGYDCVYDYINEKDRKYLTDSLWTSVVNEQTVVNTKIFNLIHNHATWSTAGVGMAGYVCGKKEWVEIALKGSKKDGSTGFLKQIDELFSPDGYYEEGPYYLRYAIQPFIIFARAINQYQPELKIYEYRNQLLKKAVDGDLQCTYTNKVFFPINDALKDKTYESEELVYAVNIAYGDMKAGDDLLDIAQQQKRVIVSDAGLQVAKAIAEGKTKPFVYKPQFIRDGADGKSGGIGILRSGKNDNQTLAVMKAGTQGMGHGHFDRLNLIFYDNNIEVLTDYGSVRFLNVETKTGGGYTKENDTWAKASIAHNTVTADKTSHYNEDWELGEKTAPSLIYFDTNLPTGQAGKNYQVVCAEENKAYSDVKMLRTAILFQPQGAESPLLLDVFKLRSATTHQYDLPFWYNGHLTNINFKYKNNNAQLNTLGSSNGYQHIWLNAEGNVSKANGAITFLSNRKFYTTTFLADSSTKVQFVTLGANDPEFNLRSEKAYIVQQPKAANHTFVNITEPHGKNNPIAEFTVGFMPVTKNIKLLSDDDNGTTFSFDYNAKTYTVHLQYKSKEKFIEISSK